MTLRARLGSLRDLGLAVAIALVVGSIAMLVAGVNPIVGFSSLLDGALGNRSELGETLIQTSALLFPALGIALAFRGGLFNIGAEGQLVLGGLAAGTIGADLHAPALVAIPAALLAGAIAGGLWGSIAGFLRARFGANEVIATLMLNVVAALLASYLVNNLLHDPAGQSSETALVLANAQLPVIVPGTRLTIAILLALAAAAIVRYVLAETIFGYELRATGEAPEAALRAGIDVRRTALLAMTWSGALAGIGGAVIVLGVLHRFNGQLSPGYGFVAIAVALVGRLDPLPITLAAFAFGILQSGAVSMQAEAGVPREIVAVVEGVVILALAGQRFLGARKSRVR